MSSPDALLIDEVRQGHPEAWTRLIEAYEGRLLSFVESRIGRRGASEDVVQETFIGFLTSLPNYDSRRPLESWLFAIAAHKLTDYLRREGRRPTVRLSSSQDSEEGPRDLPASLRGASSIARSGERRQLEEQALVDALSSELSRWRERGDWTKRQCLELLFARGQANQQVAELLSLTEQQVANYKSDFLGRLRKVLQRQGLSAEVFPELYAP